MCSLRAAGLSVSLTPDGGLHVAPRSLLTDDMRAYIRHQRDELVSMLATSRAKTASVAPFAPHTQSHANGANDGATDESQAPAEPAKADPLTASAREVLGWLDTLGPLAADQLAIAMQCPRGAAFEQLFRLRSMRLVRRRGEVWQLTREAERFALVAKERPCAAGL
jgi:hypothetical protein